MPSASYPNRTSTGGHALRDRAEERARRARIVHPHHNVDEPRDRDDFTSSRDLAPVEAPAHVEAPAAPLVDQPPHVVAYCGCPDLHYRVIPKQLGQACRACGYTLHLRGQPTKRIAEPRRVKPNALRPTRTRVVAPELPAELPERSGLSTRWAPRNFKARTVAFVDRRGGSGEIEDGRKLEIPKNASLRAILDAAGGCEVGRVVLVGPRPGGTPAGFREWFEADAGDWTPAGHYLENDRAPVLTFTRGAQRVELHRAAGWVDEGAHTPAEMRFAMDEARDAIRSKFGRDAQLLATPATTGRVLFVSSIPYGVEFDVLTDEHQDLIRQTSGQGRVEFLRPAGSTIPGVAKLDGRLMYGALCRELGSGPATHDDRPDFEGYRPGRYRVRFTVPAGWDHVGLLGVWDGERWQYPAAPGSSWETWADGAELLLAQKQGWSFDVAERLLLTPAKVAGDPLGSWARKLVEARDACIGDLARAIVRSVLLHGLGAFYAGRRLVSHSAPLDELARVPASAVNRDVVDGRVTWGEWEPARWPELSHPEWAAAVWARCRARMLSGPKNTGALHLPRSSVLAFETDALYVDHVPTWARSIDKGGADDGAAGRLRVKSWKQGPLPAPKGRPALRKAAA